MVAAHKTICARLKRRAARRLRAAPLEFGDPLKKDLKPEKDFDVNAKTSTTSR